AGLCGRQLARSCGSHVSGPQAARIKGLNRDNVTTPRIISPRYDKTRTPRLGPMTTIPESLRQLLATGPLATVVTLDPDGTPHATLAWAGFDGDELVMATFYLPEQRKIANIRRDPRVVLTFQAKEHTGEGLWPYAVVQGRVDRITKAVRWR